MAWSGKMGPEILRSASVMEEIDISKYTGQPGQVIRIGAVDLVDVARVQIVIRDSGGRVVETGAATREHPKAAFWLYQARVTLADPIGATIEAQAANWAGKQAGNLRLLGLG